MKRDTTSTGQFFLISLILSFGWISACGDSAEPATPDQNEDAEIFAYVSGYPYSEGPRHPIAVGSAKDIYVTQQAGEMVGIDTIDIVDPQIFEIVEIADMSPTGKSQRFRIEALDAGASEIEVTATFESGQMATWTLELEAAEVEEAIFEHQCGARWNADLLWTETTYESKIILLGHGETTLTSPP